MAFENVDEGDSAFFQSEDGDLTGVVADESISKEIVWSFLRNPTFTFTKLASLTENRVDKSLQRGPVKKI